MARASVLAGANDLAVAATVVEPGLVPFKRALLRLLKRPIGLSGSGPTHWALYPSLADAATAADTVRAAIDAGDLPAPGPHPPFVAAARVLAFTPGRAGRAPQMGATDDPPGSLSTRRRPVRPRSRGPGHRYADGLVFCSGQLGLDPATGRLADGRRGAGRASAAPTSPPLLDAAGAGAGRTSPRRRSSSPTSATSRRSTRSTRAVHDRPAARPLDRCRWGPSPRARLVEIEAIARRPAR